MTKRERAAAAAKWRRIARAFERGDDVAWCTCCVRTHGLCWAASRANADAAPVFEVFAPSFLDGYLWPRDREGDDCRVIAAGLMAAMCETGEFDD